MEHIDVKNSLHSKLQIYSIYFIGIRSRKWDIFRKLLQHISNFYVQPELDDKLIGQKDWFAGKVLLSLHWKNSTTLLLNPQLLEARFAEAIKLLIFNKLIMPQDYDKALMTSMRHIKWVYFFRNYPMKLFIYYNTGST